MKFFDVLMDAGSVAVLVYWVHLVVKQRRVDAFVRRAMWE